MPHFQNLFKTSTYKTTNNFLDSWRDSGFMEEAKHVPEKSPGASVHDQQERLSRPIPFLPFEILSSIFLQFLSARDKPYDSNTEPMRVEARRAIVHASQVCRDWRSVALQLPNSGRLSSTSTPTRLNASESSYVAQGTFLWQLNPLAGWISLLFSETVVIERRSGNWYSMKCVGSEFSSLASSQGW